MVIASINKIDKYIANIEIYFYYHLIICINQEYFNILRHVLYIKKLAINQLIILNKSVIIQKRSLIIGKSMSVIDSLHNNILKYQIILSDTTIFIIFFLPIMFSIYLFISNIMILNLNVLTQLINRIKKLKIL